MFNRYSIILFFSMVFFIVNGCKKNVETTTVPIVTVNVTLYTNTPSFLPLNTIGGWVYVSGGVRGIIVYRYSDTEFRAYERNCTYEPSNSCATVSVDNTNIVAVDTCCGSQFTIVDGNVIQGPARSSLVQYATYYDGNVLTISN